MDCGNDIILRLPIDLLNNITLRLPAKSLGRCMCTCKRLYSHIKSSQFIVTHLNRSKFRDVSVLVVQDACFTTFYESDTSLIKLESGRIPFPVMETDLYILGSCRGLVLVRLKVELGYVVLLWNPLLEKYKLVDTIIQDADARRPPSSWSCVFALGFHEASNDYRVLRRTHEDVVDVYSLTNDQWHRVDAALTNGNTLPYILYPEKMVTRVNGSVHWLASYIDKDFERARYEGVDDRYLVLSFDFDNEVFKVIEFPRRYTRGEHLHAFYSYPIEIKELNGKIALFVRNNADPPEQLYDTWVMMNYPLVESWTCVGCMFVEQKFSVVWPLVCTKKENCVYKLIWVEGEHVLLYFNAKEDKSYVLGIGAPYECPVIADFVDCLALLDVENDTLDVGTP